MLHVRTNNLNFISGEGLSFPIPHRRLQRLDPRSFGTCPRSKIIDPPLAPTTMLAAAPTSAPSLGRRLEVAPAPVTAAAAVAPVVA